MNRMTVMHKEAPGGLMYADLADYVVYQNGYTMSDAEFLDIDYIEYIEARIKEGSTYSQAHADFEELYGAE